jgi:nicotinamidase/pyrazinamidase
MKTFFYDVDTQNDFINPNGALYVPNAETLKDNFQKLTNYAIKNNIIILGSVDKHFGTEEYKNSELELIKNGGPFPEHCICNNIGQQKITETTTNNQLFIQSNKIIDYKNINNYKQIMFEKQSFDVFYTENNHGGNKNIYNVLNLLKQKDNIEIIVYGVATDYCVKAAVIGFINLGINTIVIEDCIKAVNINKNDGENAINLMKQIGAKFIALKNILN